MFWGLQGQDCVGYLRNLKGLKMLHMYINYNLWNFLIWPVMSTDTHVRFGENDKTVNWTRRSFCLMISFSLLLTFTFCLIEHNRSPSLFIEQLEMLHRTDHETSQTMHVKCPRFKLQNYKIVPLKRFISQNS